MTNIIKYLNHKSTLKNPSPNRFIKEAKEFLLKFSIENNLNTTDLKVIFYMFINKINIHPKCTYKDCTNYVRFTTYYQGFSKGCCHEHAKKISNLEKFGVETPFESKEIQSKIKDTCLEKYGHEYHLSSNHFKKGMIMKYGCEHAMHSPIIKNKLIINMHEKYGGMGNASGEIKLKYEESMLNKYGVKTIFSSEKFKNDMSILRTDKYINDARIKRIKTNIAKFGVINPFSSNMIREKIKKTNLYRYGVEHPMQSTIVRENTRQTNLDKYGVENPLFIGTIKDKVKKTNLEKYGVHNISLKNITNYYNYDNKSYITDNFIENKHFNVYKFCDYFGVSLSTAYAKVKSLGVEYDYNRNTSIMEEDLARYITDELNIVIERNNRSLLGIELDIYIPSYNIAIEFNGVFWHSELNGKDKRYHLNKTEKCLEKGIQLIHIFENEWINNNGIVKSIIKSKLNKSLKKVYARKTEIRHISFIEKNKFLYENHLQGTDNSNIMLGLYCESELLTIMTFGNSRYNNNYEYEIHRFCNKKDHQVYGGASKLWNYFLKTYKPTSVVTYADRRYSVGGIYKILGFEYINVSNPNYFYFKKDINLLSRLQFQKHKLANKLDLFDFKLTEWENMQLNGFNRIWDCGNYVFGWKQ